MDKATTYAKETKIMQAVLHRSKLGRTGIMQLPVNEIDANPNQPRSTFNEEGLHDLASSIAEYGIINPLSVRLHYGRYELVAGERRLRAAKIAGLETVPCMVLDVDMEQSGMLAIIENIQRQDLDFIEEARGIGNLMRMFDLSQEEIARRLGKSQSAVANKLRLLRLPPDVQASLLSRRLTERHGRALLRLATAQEQRDALEYIIENGLNVAQTDAYMDKLLEPKEAEPEPEPKRRRAFILKDVRIFFNTLTRSIDMMKQGGIDAGVNRQETDSEFIVTISIPKKQSEASK